MGGQRCGGSRIWPCELMVAVQWLSTTCGTSGRPLSWVALAADMPVSHQCLPPRRRCHAAFLSAVTVQADSFLPTFAVCSASYLPDGEKSQRCSPTDINDACGRHLLLRRSWHVHPLLGHEANPRFGSPGQAAVDPQPRPLLGGAAWVLVMSTGVGGIGCLVYLRGEAWVVMLSCVGCCCAHRHSGCYVIHR